MKNKKFALYLLAALAVATGIALLSQSGGIGFIKADVSLEGKIQLVQEAIDGLKVKINKVVKEIFIKNDEVLKLTGQNFDNARWEEINQIREKISELSDELKELNKRGGSLEQTRLNLLAEKFSDPEVKLLRDYHQEKISLQESRRGLVEGTDRAKEESRRLSETRRALQADLEFANQQRREDISAALKKINDRKALLRETISSNSKKVLFFNMAIKGLELKMAGLLKNLRGKPFLIFCLSFVSSYLVSELTGMGAEPPPLEAVRKTPFRDPDFLEKEVDQDRLQKRRDYFALIKKQTDKELSAVEEIRLEALKRYFLR